MRNQRRTLLSGTHGSCHTTCKVIKLGMRASITMVLTSSSRMRYSSVYTWVDGSDLSKVTSMLRGPLNMTRGELSTTDVAGSTDRTHNMSPKASSSAGHEHSLVSCRPSVNPLSATSSTPFHATSWLL